MGGQQAASDDGTAIHGRSITLDLMHIDTLTGPEQRVLGCLIEKRFTTPEQYPLTLNALRLACNQSTNRDPVVDYDEETVRRAAQRLAQYGLTRLASGHTSRATKYRHLAEEALGLGREQLAVLSVLLLRGPQTPGELKGRSERVVTWQSLADVERVLGELIERGYARRLERRPGQKEERYAQLLGTAPADGDPAAPTVAPTTPRGEPTASRGEPTAPSVGPPATQAPAAALVAKVDTACDVAGAGGIAGVRDVARADGQELVARLDALETRVEQLATLLEQLTGEPLSSESADSAR